MRILSVPALHQQTSLNGYALQAPEGHSAGYGPAKLHALGGPAAVMDAGSATNDAAAFDEWSSGFDIHLGVYSRD